MRLLRHWGSDRQVLLGLDLPVHAASSITHCRVHLVQRTTLQSQEAHDSEWRSRWERAAGVHASQPSRRASLYQVALSCRPYHTCDRPPDGSVLTRHAEAAVGGTPIIRVDLPRHLIKMSTAFSQDFVQADRLIRRRYVQIPGKQKDLLERPDAWSEDLSHGPRGMINVPPEVIQDLKDFHARRHSKPSQQPNITQPPSSAGSSAPPKLNRPKQPLSSPRLGQDDQAGDDGATQLSWSPSPSRPPPGRRSVQPTEQPEPASPLRNQLTSHLTPLKRKTPPVSSGFGPPSSTAQSDSVPYEPLSALGKEPHPPVNRGANRVAATQLTLPAATPPSAQAEVIPSTLSNTGQGQDQVGSVAARPFNKRRRVEDIEFSDKEHETTEQEGPLLDSNSKPRPMATHDDRNNSSASASTPSFRSQAVVGRHQRSESDILQAASAGGSNEQSSSHYTPTYEGRPRDTPTQQKNVFRHTTSGSSMPPAPGQPPAEPTHSELVKVHQSHAETTVGHRTPYEEFKAAYPDYEESTRAFIRACLSVEKLESERALPEFMYDDFVRVYSTLYMDYFTEVQSRKYKEVLKATQWYNENVKDMVYTKKIIRRDNLPAILKAHSTAVRQVRESIRADIEALQSTEDGNSKQESDEDMADDGGQDREEELGLDESKAEDSSESRLSPEFHIPSPGPAATTRPTVVEDESEGVDKPSRTVPASSQMRQYTETAEEDPLDGSPRDEMAAAEGFHRSRVSSTSNPQQPDTVLDEEALVKEVTRGTERTPPSRKPPKPSQSRRKEPTTADSARKSSFSPRELLAPLPSSSPSKVMANVSRPANDKAVSPPTKKAARQSSPAFRSQAESSDDESDSFDPPVEKAAKAPSRQANSNEPAFLTQAQDVYEIPGTPDRLSEEPMPPPPPQPVTRTPAAPQPRTVQGQTASPAQDEVVRRHIPERERVASRSSVGSSIGARKSPASSNRSRASLDLFKPRVGETKEERSKRNRERIRKFLSNKTPGSTPANTK